MLVFCSLSVNAMPSGTELASVIRTWTAVVLALVALFGIVTPILLLSRANSERNIALDAIDDKEHEFVRRHIKLPGHSNFGRSFNVPNLENVPALHHLSLWRNDRALERTHSTTSWIRRVSGNASFTIHFRRH